MVGAPANEAVTNRSTLACSWDQSRRNWAIVRPWCPDKAVKDIKAHLEPHPQDSRNATARSIAGLRRIAAAVLPERRRQDTAAAGSGPRGVPVYRTFAHRCC